MCEVCVVLCVASTRPAVGRGEGAKRVGSCSSCGLVHTCHPLHLGASGRKLFNPPPPLTGVRCPLTRERERRHVVLGGFVGGWLNVGWGVRRGGGVLWGDGGWVRWCGGLLDVGYVEGVRWGEGVRWRGV